MNLETIEKKVFLELKKALRGIKNGKLLTTADTIHNLSAFLLNEGFGNYDIHYKM